MKKNIALRLASGLMLSCLLSTCVISGTFAKYTTSNKAEDSARVAKWGVTVTATGDDAFATNYNDATSGTKVVSTVNVVAPGTNGQLAAASISGTPEVMVDVIATANLELNGWEIGSEEYCPIVFTVGDEEIKMGGSITTIDALEQAVEAKITAWSATNVAANTDLTRNIEIDWAWAFDGEDEKDTALGNQAVTGTAATISFEFEITVNQVN